MTGEITLRVIGCFGSAALEGEDPGCEKMAMEIALVPTRTARGHGGASWEITKGLRFVYMKNDVLAAALEKEK